MIYINDEYARQGATIEDYINNNLCTVESRYYNGGEIPEGSPILNVVMINGLQPDKNNMVIRKLYPELFEACLKHVKQKNHSTVMVYKEEGKPDVYNLFIRDTNGRIMNRAICNARRFMNKTGNKRYAFVSDGGNESVEAMKYYFRYGYYFYKFNKPIEHNEDLLDTVYGDLPF